MGTHAQELWPIRTSVSMKTSTTSDFELIFIFLPRRSNLKFKSLHRMWPLEYRRRSFQIITHLSRVPMLHRERYSRHIELSIIFNKQYSASYFLVKSVDWDNLFRLSFWFYWARITIWNFFCQALVPCWASNHWQFHESTV